MRLQTKAWLLLGAYIFIPIFVALIFDITQNVAPILGFFWVIANGICAIAFIRCPHCDESGFNTPSGWRVFWTGAKCRFCGKDY